jgi:hypothetical protein
MKEYIDFSPELSADAGAGVGQTEIVADVPTERTAEARRNEVALATAELLRIWEAPEDGAWAFRRQNHHGNR